MRVAGPVDGALTPRRVGAANGRHEHEPGLIDEDDPGPAGVPDELLDFKPHEKTNPIRTILVHQLLSERRFFAQFVGTEEPPVEELLPAGETPGVQAYIDKYIGL